MGRGHVERYSCIIPYLRCTYCIGVIVLQYNTVRIFGQDLYCRPYYGVRIRPYLRRIYYWLHCFRLRLPGALSSYNADDRPDILGSVEATPSRMAITLFRDDPISHTVLAITTLRYDSCSTLLIFSHLVSKQQREAVVSRSTSIFTRVFDGSGICIRYVTASLPELVKPKSKSPQLIENEVEISAFLAWRLALEIVKEAQLRENASRQGTARGGQNKRDLTILERLAIQRSDTCGRDGSNFTIPNAGDILLPTWLKSYDLIHY